MKKMLVVGIIIILVGMSVPSTGINVEKVSNTSYDGNTLYVGGSGPGNYTKIQDAIDNASDGDTVFVYNGTYSEYIDICKSISLIGENREDTIIKSTALFIEIPGVEISGFHISSGDQYSIIIWHTNNTTINENK